MTVHSDIGGAELRRGRGYLMQPGLAELTPNVMVGGQAVAAIGLQRDVGGLPGGIGSQQLGHVGFGPTRLTPIEAFGRPKLHEVGGFHMAVRLGDGKLDALVLCDGATIEAALFGALSCPLNEPLPISNSSA